MTSCKQISQINDNPSLKQLQHWVSARNISHNLKYNRCLLLITPAEATCEDRKEPNQHRVVLSRLKATFSAAKKKTNILGWISTKRYCEQQQNSWSVYIGSGVLFGIFTTINGWTLRVGTPSSCVFSWHVGLPPVFFFSHPPRVSQAHRRDCSNPFKLHRLQHRTHLLLLPEDHAGEKDSNRHRSARQLRQGRRTFVRMLGEFVLKPRRRADREETLDRFQLWHAEAGSYSQTTRWFIFTYNICLWQQISQKYTHICFRKYTYT